MYRSLRSALNTRRGQCAPQVNIRCTLVRGCHILEASDSDSTEPTHVAVTPDQGIDLGASIASLRDVPIVDTDPSEDGWGIDDDLGASEDEASAKTVIEAVARAITNYGRRCRAEHLPDHDAWASDLRTRCAETLNINDRVGRRRTATACWMRRLVCGGTTSILRWRNDTRF